MNRRTYWLRVLAQCGIVIAVFALSTAIALARGEGTSGPVLPTVIVSAAIFFVRALFAEVPNRRRVLANLILALVGFAALFGPYGVRYAAWQAVGLALAAQLAYHMIRPLEHEKNLP